MENLKKLQLANRRYIKNFVNGMDDAHARYEEAKYEIASVVESNDVEQDHKLLIRMYIISSYWLEVWKNDVLINGKNSTTGLKQIQQVVFYQCMCRHIYKDRYPKMKLIDYSFESNMIGLIHLNMFGWSKEEEIFFDFISNYFGENIMEANDWKQHIWFVLELYLQYTNKTILGTNDHVHLAARSTLEDRDKRCDLIPEELGIYREVLDRWNTPDLDEITQLIAKMSDHHSTLASDLGESLEFGDFDYAFYPYEILFLLHVRKKQGLPNPNHFDDFLMNTPEATMDMQDPEPYPELDPLLRMIDDFYRKNYPEYIPNQHGELFQ
ncbi:MAG: hypothetical protein IKE29_22185 [Paenibacillus sp.]|uniref:hypothetical protein n=1 Tax=Paenibacillus sp. TaxID=58172 RepID=UPI0025E40B77|nr:hypothetical protein [Paenibacillus sp.]MBR2567303.1 hypothetical protein [Paenibacillus sp.]